MKIGLLECDHVADAFHGIAGDYRDMFPALFPEWDFVNYDLINGQFPEDLNACDAYLCTGSKHSVYEPLPWIEELKRLMRALHQAQTCFVGVCFGHQMMAEALGGKVSPASVGWCIGMHTFEPLLHEAWMQPPQDQVNLLMLCQDQVVNLPPASKVLAKSADCPIGMFRVGHHMLGIQAHPEFTPAYDRAVFLSRVDRIGEAKVAAALDSLQRPNEAQVMANWIRSFVNQALRRT